VKRGPSRRSILAGSTPEAEAERALAALGMLTQWRGTFATVTNESVRLRSLPTTEAPAASEADENGERGR
jgi:hypothetical protein